MAYLINFRKPAILTLAAIAVLLTSLYTRTPLSYADELVPGEKPESDSLLSPAGKLLLDTSTGLPAVTPLTVNFVRSPDSAGPDGKGRYLIAVNSGYGVEFNSKSKGNQTISVIDLSLTPEPKVIQTLYFPAPQSANVGLSFDTCVKSDGKFQVYVSGGFENKIWILSFDPAGKQPLSPQNKADEKLEAPFIDVSSFSENAPSPDYNSNVAAVYPTGIALSPDGQSLYVANNLGDTLGIVSDLRNSRKITRVSLRQPGSSQFVYPYDVKLLTRGPGVSKAYVSLWGSGSIAVVNPALQNRTTFIPVDRHPTAMLFNQRKTRLYVVNSNADKVSVINTATDSVIETINVRLNETARLGASPEGIALSDDERTLYVANAHARAVAVISIAPEPARASHSKLLGFIPTGKYASAVAVVGNHLFIANGKGTGMENSSNVTNQSELYPNMPNKEYPGDTYNKRGEYSVAIVSGNISYASVPDEKQLFDYTQSVMRNNGLIGREKRNIFPGGVSPFKHVIYVIRENRTYDQVLGDMTAGGSGKADGAPNVAIFGAGDAAKSPNGTKQNITPNAHELALRFGLLDRFFVNAEASPDGHNWSTAAFSNDYVDKAFRWNYSRRGRTYDFEGFNRLPSFNPPANQPPVALPPVFNLPATETDVANFLKKYVPYLNGARDVAEPESLYLWDAAKRAGLSYRSYGEFIATVSAEDVQEVNAQKPKKYPDTSRTLTAFAAKKTLEGHFSPAHRNFDMDTPDSMTTDSYSQAKGADPAISEFNPNPAFHGNSRFGAWAAEFRGFVADLQAGKGDHLPNLSIVRFSNDHTAGMSRGKPTPQFYVAENDYAVGRLVEEVSKSPYWKDTAIFIVEDDAQDGPDHVDAHRSPGLIISAYNRPGLVIHDFHNTVSLIRTLELCLGLPAMNFLDENATPIDIFGSQADLRPYAAQMPNVALDNLITPQRPATGRTAYFENLTERQDLRHADMANPRELNEAIWFSVKGDTEMPAIARLPAFDLLTTGVKPDTKEERGRRREHDADDD